MSARVRRSRSSHGLKLAYLDYPCPTDSLQGFISHSRWDKEADGEDLAQAMTLGACRQKARPSARSGRGRQQTVRAGQGGAAYGARGAPNHTPAAMAPCESMITAALTRPLAHGLIVRCAAAQRSDADKVQATPARGKRNQCVKTSTPQRRLNLTGERNSIGPITI